MDALNALMMGLTIEGLIGRITGIIAAVSVFIEITPIKINPVSAILGWVGERLNKDVNKKLDDLERKIDDLEDSVDELEESNVIAARVRILTFADEIRRNIKHSYESFDQVLSDIDTYDKYCESHEKFQNNKTVAAKKQIIEVHAKCMEQNDFL